MADPGWASGEGQDPGAYVAADGVGVGAGQSGDGVQVVQAGHEDGHDPDGLSERRGGVLQPRSFTTAADMCGSCL